MNYQLDDPSSEPQGDRRALDELFGATYEELRRLASVVRRGDQQATLTPTALVNEAWLKLAGSPSVGALSRLHFKRIAARAMRQILIEAARRRKASKRRGAPGGLQITFDESLEIPAVSGEELLVLDRTLDDLSRIHPRQAQIVEARFFGGFSVSETAELLGMSDATVLRDWRVAKAFLSRQLRHTP
jgi:RNA polymerase sigma factor (TIGR02999 family)